MIRATGSLDGTHIIEGATQDALRAVGAWPSGQSLAQRLIDAFDNTAEQEPDPHRKRRLHDIGSWLQGAGSDLTAKIVAEFAARQINL